MIALAIEYRQAEKNTPPVHSKLLGINVKLRNLDCMTLGLHDESALTTQFCVLSESAEEF
jgi:hypothetical protein